MAKIKQDKRILSQYMHPTLNLQEFKTNIKRAKARLKGLDFQAIAVIGNSGTLFGGALALAMNKDIILGRKDGLSTHCKDKVEGFIPSYGEKCKYLIVDDFTETYKTIEDLKAEIGVWFKKNKSRESELKCIGAYLYKHDSLRFVFADDEGDDDEY